MAALTTINQLGAAIGDTFAGRAVTRIIADGSYIFGDIELSVSSVQIDAAPSVAANTLARHDPVTSSGPLDYVRLNDQVLVVEPIDLTSEVVGVLPIANMATGTPNGKQFLRDDGALATVAPGPSNSAGVHTATRLHANVSTNDTSYALSAERIALEDPSTGESIVISVGGTFFNSWWSTAEGFRDLYLWSNEAGNNLEITDVDRAATPVAPADKPFGGFVGTVQFTAPGVLKTMLQSGDTFSFAPTQIWDATGFIQQFPNAFASYAAIAPTNAKAILFGHITLEMADEVKAGVAIVFAQDNVSLAGQRQMISESNKDRVAFASGWWPTHAQQQSLVWGASNDNTNVMHVQAFISAYRV